VLFHVTCSECRSRPLVNVNVNVNQLPLVALPFNRRSQSLLRSQIRTNKAIPVTGRRGSHIF
jgi:hypothetical protein